MKNFILILLTLFFFHISQKVIAQDQDPLEDWRQTHSINKEQSVKTVISSELNSQNPPNFAGSIVIDDYIFSFDKILWDFLEVAFSNYLWMQNDDAYYAGGPVYKPMPNVDYLEKNDKSYQYFKEYMNLNSSFINQGRLHKWEKKNINIAIGWPWKTYETNDPDIARLTSYADNFVSVLNEITGTELKLTGANDKDTPQIIIAPIKAQYPENSFKTDEITGRHGTLEFEWWFKDLITSGVEFAPASKKNIDGGILVDKNNAITNAFCLIPVGISNADTEILVRECLIRSMGLPGTSANQNSLLADRANLDNKNNFLVSASNARNPNVFIENDSLISFKKLFQQRADGTGNLLQYDFLMMKILYCPEIKSGFDKNEVVNQLANKKTCISPLFIRNK